MLLRLVHRQQRQLVTSEERYRATFVGAPVGIAHVGLDGRFLRFNEAVRDPYATRNAAGISSCTR